MARNKESAKKALHKKKEQHSSRKAQGKSKGETGKNLKAQEGPTPRKWSRRTLRRRRYIATTKEVNKGKIYLPRAVIRRHAMRAGGPGEGRRVTTGFLTTLMEAVDDYGKALFEESYKYVPRKVITLRSREVKLGGLLLDRLQNAALTR